MMGLIHTFVFAETFTYEGIDYTIVDTTAKTCKTKPGTYNYYNGKRTAGNNISGEVTIPQTVLNGEDEYIVIGLGRDAFYGCDKLTSINLPPNLQSIESEAFYSCTSLTKVNIPASVTNLASDAFWNCTGLKIIDIESIEQWCKYEFVFASSNCYPPTYFARSLYLNGEKITDLVIPENITTLHKGVFACLNLNSIVIPPNVTTIDPYAFYGVKAVKWFVPTSFDSRLCNATPGNIIKYDESINSFIYDDDNLLIYNKDITNLLWVNPSFHGDLNLPNSIAKIGSGAIANCENIEKLVLSKNIELLDNNIFQNASIKALIILGTYPYSCFNSLNTESNLYCFPMTYDLYSRYLKCNVYNMGLADITAEPMICGIKVKLNRIDTEIPIDIWGDTSNFKYYVSVIDNDSNQLQRKELNFNDVVSFNNLKFNTQYNLQLLWENTPYDGSITKTVHTQSPTITCNSIETTQTSLSVKDLNFSYDESVDPINKKVSLNGETYSYTGRTINFSNLFPNNSYKLYISADYNGQIFTSSIDIKTKDIGLSCNTQSLSPTSVILNGKCASGDAIIEKTWWENMNWDSSVNSIDGNVLQASGLRPSYNYSANFCVQLKNGYKKSIKYNFTTAQLKLLTLKPNCVSATTANVMAETNISNTETRVGFQWKKYDAPTSLSPNEGYGFVYDGVIEGQIKNLQSASYYNVRAFYKSADGTYYYGDWITFDPSDFSYFDPQVRSFNNPEIVQNNVTLKGYVLEGTDEIISQGFQYWNNNTRTQIEDNIITIYSSGQLMQVTLNNLIAGNYSYRAFVETSNGYYYGDEYTFSIESSGIEEVIVANTENFIIGYYNFNGVKFDKPQKGFNLVVYKDGRCKKIFLK